ncbi:MAG TPA: hypothetical protein ENN96_01195 [Candidatus Acetothermia bacterium]|nr:hypothetical protein [Candidatus Acetothermia bacterium]
MAFGAMGTPWVHGPYSGAPTAEEVTISWRTTASYPTSIAYWTVERPDERQILRVAPEEQQTGETMHARLTGLLPRTAYAYQVVLETSQGEERSAVGQFRTETDPGEPVRFFVLADTQWQWDGENRLRAVGEAMAGDTTDVDFVLHGGDLVESPSSQNWDHWFRSFDTLLLRAPLLAVLGNHERNHGSYYDQLALPPGGGRRDKQWWAFHWGDVVIVGLDTNVRQAPQMIEQQEWARTHLSGPEEHKFVVFHHPVFSSDAYHGSGYSYDVIYHPIFVESGVDIVFNGHAHNYERLEVDGVTYLVVGGGGAVPRALADSRVQGSIVAREGYNFYLRVEASPRGIDVDVISVARADEETFERTGGELLDRFRLTSPGSVERRGSVWRLLAVGVAAVILLVLLTLQKDTH